MSAGSTWKRIRRLGYVELYAIGEPQIEKANQLAAEFGVEKTEADYRRILEDPAVDAVHICTPNFLHFPIAKDALQAGKHVICEKPLATSVDEAQELVATGARHQTAQLPPSTTCASIRMVQQMRRMREDGDLGEILVVQGTYSQDWLLYDTDWNWRLDSQGQRPFAHAWPISARTGATWRSTSPAQRITSRLRRSADVPQDPQAAQRDRSRPSPARR